MLLNLIYSGAKIWIMVIKCSKKIVEQFWRRFEGVFPIFRWINQHFLWIPFITVEKKYSKVKTLPISTIEKYRGSPTSRVSTSMNSTSTIFSTSIGIKFVLVEFVINKFVLVKFSLCTTQLVRISHSTIFFQVPKFVLSGIILV